MVFKSILYLSEYEETITNVEPCYFKNLNLDQIVGSITNEKSDYDLKSFFYSPLRHPETLNYRQSIIEDLANPDFFKTSEAFSEKIFALNNEFNQCVKNMECSREGKTDYLEKGKYIDYIESYCEEVRSYYACMKHTDLKSSGFLALAKYFGDTIQSDGFKTLNETTFRLKDELFHLDYCLLIKGDTVKVKKFEGETDLGREVVQLLERFRPPHSVKVHTDQLHEALAAHVENGILNLVAKLYPLTFSKLDDYCLNFRDFMNETILTFAREVQFYIAYMDYINPIKTQGLSFCLPEITTSKADIFNDDGFDLALAVKLNKTHQKMVCNHFFLENKERIIIVSGPNQGGKTTFSRHFGQLHHLGCLGLPVQGTRAKIFLFDQIFTHFEQEENIKSLQGKLSDDLIRIKSILDAATPNSIVIINEILSSTTLNDAIMIGEKLISKLSGLDLLCVFVTFIIELAANHQKIVSMVSTVSEEDASERTYRLVRREPDGLAYAKHIAQRYQLDYASLIERIQS